MKYMVIFIRLRRYRSKLVFFGLVDADGNDALEQTRWNSTFVPLCSTAAPY